MNRSNENPHRYDDMLDLPHHVSKVHPQMPMKNRAAQFSPFAALTGYDAAVRETERLTEERIELDESQKEEIAERVQTLLDMGRNAPEAAVTWFQPDAQKAGGAYITKTGRLLKYDAIGRILIMEDGTIVPLDNLYGIESPVFHSVAYE